MSIQSASKWFRPEDGSHCLVLGDRWPQTADAARSRDHFEALKDGLGAWGKQVGGPATPTTVTLVGEEWDLGACDRGEDEFVAPEAAKAAEEARARLQKEQADESVDGLVDLLQGLLVEGKSHAQGKQDDLSSRVLGEAQTMQAAGQPVHVELCRTGIFVRLLDFLQTTVEFWKPLGEDSTDEADLARLEEFLHFSHDCTWSQLLNGAQAVSSAAQAAMRAHPTTKQVMGPRIEAFEQSIELARLFAKDFAAPGSDHKERYARAFFRCVEREKDQALERWCTMAHNLAFLARELALFTALLTACFGGEQKQNAGKGSKVGVFVEHNLAISVAELISATGFRAVVYSGSAERTDPDVPPADASKELTGQNVSAMLKHAWETPRVLRKEPQCDGCGKKEGLKDCGGCGEVKFCSRECLKRNWKRHKPVCKAVQSVRRSAKATILLQQVQQKEMQQLEQKHLEQQRKVGKEGSERLAAEHSKQKQQLEQKHLQQQMELAKKQKQEAFQRLAQGSR